MGRLTAFHDDVYAATHPPGIADGDDFALATARTLGWAAQLGYEAAEAAKFQAVAARWGWNIVGVIRQFPDQSGILAGTKAFVAEIGPATVVAFPGTEPDSIIHIGTDLAFLPDAHGISRGFTHALDSVWTDLTALLTANDRPVLLAGHSLGGALAVIAALRLHRAGAHHVQGVYTFGMPRTGTATFAADYTALNTVTYRFRHGRDVVPALPPVALAGHRHVGRELHCVTGGAFTLDQLDAAAAPSAATPPTLPGFPGLTHVASGLVDLLPGPARDHMMDRYLWALRDAAIRALPT